MKTKIIITGSNGNFTAQIYVNEKWFKEVGGCPSIDYLLIAIANSLKNDEDYNINPMQYYFYTML